MIEEKPHFGLGTLINSTIKEIHEVHRFPDSIEIVCENTAYQKKTLRLIIQGSEGYMPDYEIKEEK